MYWVYKSMNLLKNICDYEINYKFHLSLLEADKKTFLSKHFVLWNVRLRYESGFNLIFFFQTSIYFLRYSSVHTQQNLCISWINRRWGLLNLFHLFWLWFPFESWDCIRSILLFIFSLFFYLTSYKFTLHNPYLVHM